MSNEKIQWHPAFVAALKLELKEYADVLEITEEYQLTEKPLQIDVVLIKKNRDIVIEKNIARIFHRHNIVEYKSPDDYLSIDDYYKVKAYTYLYKTLAEHVDEIKVKDLTITLTSVTYPVKLIKHLEAEQGIKLVKKYDGIYYCQNADIPMQILVIKEMSADDSSYLTLLQKQLKKKDKLQRFITEYMKNNKNSLYDLLLDVIAKANSDTLLEVFGMAYGELSEYGEKLLEDVAHKLNWDSKWGKKFREEGWVKGKEEGIEEGIEQGIEKGIEKGIEEGIKKVAKNMLNQGAEVEFVAKMTGLSVEDVKSINKDM